MRAIKLFAVLVPLLIALPAAAQPLRGDLNAVLETLKIGERIWVMENMKPEIAGEIVELNSSTWVVATSLGHREIPAQDIMRIRRQHSDSLWNGALIGAAVGMAPWIAWCAPMTESGETCGENGGMTVAALLGGAVIGVLIDAAKQGKQMIYQRPDARRRGRLLGVASHLVVSPVLSEYGMGAHVSFAFPGRP